MAFQKEKRREKKIQMHLKENSSLVSMLHYDENG